MKVLSIQQPWAWFIVNGYKDIENRSWYTSYRGPILIHAGKKFDKDGWEYIRQNLVLQSGVEEGTRITRESVQEQCGGIVGYTEITDCVTNHPSPWFFGEYGFTLANSRPLPFYPCKGQLGFFNAPEGYVLEDPGRE
jgi:hypothetical protein